MYLVLFGIVSFLRSEAKQPPALSPKPASATPCFLQVVPRMVPSNRPTTGHFRGVRDAKGSVCPPIAPAPCHGCDQEPSSANALLPAGQCLAFSSMPPDRYPRSDPTKDPERMASPEGQRQRWRQRERKRKRWRPWRPRQRKRGAT